jgi:hypothetical protein
LSHQKHADVRIDEKSLETHRVRAMFERRNAARQRALKAGMIEFHPVGQVHDS